MVIAAAGGNTTTLPQAQENLFNFDVGATTARQTGTDLADRMVGTEGNDNLEGLKGNDVLIAQAGNDHVRGNAGDDVLVGGQGNDTLRGGNGFDTAILAGTADDFIAGRDADGHLTLTNRHTGERDVLRSMEQVIFRSANGDTTLSIADVEQLGAAHGAGAVIPVLPGADWSAGQPVPLDAQQAMDPVVLPGAPGVVTTPSDPIVLPPAPQNAAPTNPAPAPQAPAPEAPKPEAKPAEPGAKINGSMSADKLNGTDGSDYVRGLMGNDAVNAGDGNDTIVGGSGNDAVDGGDGTDTAILFDRSKDWSISRTSEGYIQMKSFKTGEVDLYDNIEKMTFTDGTFTVEELLGRGW